jgi:hypothetical protein
MRRDSVRQERAEGGKEMNTNHSHFELLCALAGSVQLTSTEMTELQEHSERCLSCRSRLVEINQLSVDIFCTHALSEPGTRMPNGARERFIAQANREGVPLSSRTLGIGMGGSSWAAALVLGLLLVLSALHFGPPKNSADMTAKADRAGVSKSPFKEKGTSPYVSESGLANRVPAGQTRSQLAP